MLPGDKRAHNGRMRKYLSQHTGDTNYRSLLQKRPIKETLLCKRGKLSRNILQHAATRCNTLQHTATHCNTLQHTATHCNTHLSGILPEDNRAGNGLVRKAPSRLQCPVAYFALKYLPYREDMCYEFVKCHEFMTTVPSRMLCP